ncbi:putative membrane protein YdfK [Paraliobacillus ryukyuensis]|uniref:Membrane protein YdfK n=1 Tax=Paraliobacillus ryukyuensis TaxID=200904 RepID=A0A366EC64_9BACI|nr:DUF554 domain-containing protein [Paraliobacillus ryukyuensis]RBO99927.1 hypothetical protein DES48_103255 [Paraliobacillus ryukyuensis]
MVLTGTLVNGLAIILGTTIGLFFTNIPDRFKETILKGIGISIIIIGLQMALQVNHVVILLLSIIVGAVIGEMLKIEHYLNKLGEWVGTFISTNKSDSRISQGFITATLIFVVGAMAIVGALDGGLRGDHQVLFTKSILDGFTAMVLATTLGFGVMLSVIPVVIYQGSIALLATTIQRIIPDAFLEVFITEMTAVGGVLIVAIGLKMLDIIQIRLANLLPSLVVVGCLLAIYQQFS